jgi:hypothetical protein
MKVSQPLLSMSDNSQSKSTEVSMCQSILAQHTPKGILLNHTLNLNIPDAETQPELPYKNALLLLNMENIA